MNKIGYKNPPKHTQFKKGVSGNPMGRFKKQRAKLGDPYHEMATILAEKVIVKNANGKPAKVSKQLLLYVALVNIAIKGNIKAISLVLQIIDKLPSGYKDPLAMWSRTTPEQMERSIKYFEEEAAKYLAREKD